MQPEIRPNDFQPALNRARERLLSHLATAHEHVTRGLTELAEKALEAALLDLDTVRELHDKARKLGSTI